MFVHNSSNWPREILLGKNRGRSSITSVRGSPSVQLLHQQIKGVGVKSRPGNNSSLSWILGVGPKIFCESAVFTTGIITKLELKCSKIGVFFGKTFILTTK